MVPSRTFVSLGEAVKLDSFVPLDKDDIVASLDIASVAAELRLEFEGETMRCPDPDHLDEHPSTSIFYGEDTKQRWKCHSCGAHGDVIDLVATVEGLSYSKALERCSELAGMELPEPTRITYMPADLLGSWARSRAVIASDIAWDAPYTAGWLAESWGVRAWGDTLLIPNLKEDDIISVRHRAAHGEKWFASGSRCTDLYGAWRDRGRKEVLLVEGERDCWLTAALFPDADVFALQGIHSRPNLEILRGRHVVLLIDADEESRKAAPRIIAALEEVAETVLVADLPDGLDATDAGPDAVRAAVRDAYGPEEAPAPELSDVPDDTLYYSETDLTDTGFAVRLIRLHGRKLRYVPEWNTWLVWDGRRWFRDTGNLRVTEHAKGVSSQLYRQAASVAPTNPDLAKTLAKAGSSAASAAKLRAMVDLARSIDGVAVSPADLDTHDWWLNVRNGTIDLETGTLRPHRAEDLLTTLADVDYAPEATCPRWDAFLEQVLPDPDVREYLASLTGYSATGNTGERLIPIPFGAGRNGKSVFLETVRDVLGSDYAAKTESSAVLTRKGSGSGGGYELATLPGKRFVYASELPSGAALDVATIKEMSSGSEPMRVREIYGKPFTFQPRFTVWVGTNFLPSIPADDQAAWDRVRVIPFFVRIADDEVDRRLAEKLRDEFSGILAWIVRGCLSWQRDGLKTPSAIARETIAYRAEQDILGRFLADEADFMAAYPTSGGLRVRLELWCAANGEDIPKPKEITSALQRAGWSNKRRRDGDKVIRSWHAPEHSVLRDVQTPRGTTFDELLQIAAQAETPSDAEEAAYHAERVAEAHAEGERLAREG